MQEKIIQITAGRGPLECQWVVAKVLKTFLQEATQAGISYTILSREEGDANLTVKSVTLQLKGKELAPFLKSWLGTVCWVGKSTFRKFHQRSNWYIGVFELDQLQRQTFSERDVQFQTTRSQGNGGQNVNKVNSAVRATHLPTGVSVFAQDSRSQLDNKNARPQPFEGKARRNGASATCRASTKPLEQSHPSATRQPCTHFQRYRFQKHLCRKKL